jgi:hypothetical protein
MLFAHVTAAMARDLDYLKQVQREPLERAVGESR